jgi:hypothetical protein
VDWACLEWLVPSSTIMRFKKCCLSHDDRNPAGEGYEENPLFSVKLLAVTYQLSDVFI